MLVSDGKGISSADNLAVGAHPAWAQISIFDVPSHGQAPEGDGDDKYDPKDHPWTNTTMREGQFCDRNAVIAVDPGQLKHAVQFITIVNLTPYNFKYLKDQSHKYQMTDWDFDDIGTYAGYSRWFRVLAPVADKTSCVPSNT